MSDKLTGVIDTLRGVRDVVSASDTGAVRRELARCIEALTSLRAPCTCAAFTRAVEVGGITAEVWDEETGMPVAQPAGVARWRIVYPDTSQMEVIATPFAEPISTCPFCGAPAREVNR